MASKQQGVAADAGQQAAHDARGKRPTAATGRCGGGVSSSCGNDSGCGVGVSCSNGGAAASAWLMARQAEAAVLFWKLSQKLLSLLLSLLLLCSCCCAEQAPPPPADQNQQQSTCPEGWGGPRCDYCAFNWAGENCDQCMAGWGGLHCEIHIPPPPPPKGPEAHQVSHAQSHIAVEKRG